MLRSYEFCETDSIAWKNKEPSIFRKELEIAEMAVKATREADKDRNRNRACPVCGSSEHMVLYQKWGTPYLLCENCCSIFCDCDDVSLDCYVKSTAMTELRLSKDYQQDAMNRRQENWEETIRWLQFRIFRYLNKREGVSIIDLGNRYTGFVNMIRKAPFCGDYDLRWSILEEDTFRIKEADVVLFMNGLQQIMEPAECLTEIGKYLKPGGILVLSARAGSGFDILTLREKHEYIYPFEHITLPSVNGLVTLLDWCGYHVLEVTTPGVMDVSYVLQNQQSIQEESLFIKYMMRGRNSSTLLEFQRFLQKNCMSSYVQVIAVRM